MKAILSKVGVVGGGRMGSGIAHLFLTQGVRVTVIERDPDSARRSYDRIAKVIEVSRQRGAVTESGDAVMTRLTVGTDMTVLPGDSELVIEAVPEAVPMKIDILGRIESVVTPSTVIASNTSSLSINELSAGLTRPDRFLGMHFFNPVPVSLLVEIVSTGSVDCAIVERVASWVKAIGKEAVCINDAPGFATSRLGVALGLEAIRMVEDGVGSAETIDRAITLSYKHPVGPLRLTDIVGLDVRLAVADYLAGRLGERFRAPQLLRSMVAEGRTGRKAGSGFYEWDSN